MAALPLAGAIVPSAWAAPIQVAQASSVGKSAAAEAARSAYGGKVLKIEEVKKGNKTLYRVRLLLDDGRVKTVTVDGSSGKVV